MRRAMEIKFRDGTSKFLELSKVTAIKADIGTLSLDRLKDNTWRLVFSDTITEDFSQIVSFNVIRE